MNFPLRHYIEYPISNAAALEVAFPRMLLATHRYSPLSTLFTFVIVNCFLSAEKLILELIVVFKGYPFLVHDIAGSGFAVASQGNVTFPPSSLATLLG